MRAAMVRRFGDPDVLMVEEVADPSPGHSVATNTLWGRNLVVLGFSVGFYLPAHKELGRPAGQAALKAIEDGLISIDIDGLTLDQAPEAHRRMESGQLTGRIVLRP